MALDPTKHVNYVEGMVLGAADLRQEFAYLSHRDQWVVRDLLGYGTVWGLQVTHRVGSRGPEIVVASGVAINPRGQLIRVAPAQCAPLNDWLAGRTSEVTARRLPTADANVFSLPLYVVLRYRSCDVDPVPIAGEPCRTEQDSLAPSRTADGFQLELAFEPPPQPEEDAQREFVKWQRAHITVTAGGAASLGIPQFLDAIRAAAAAGVAAPGDKPRLIDSSPPTVVSVPAALLPDYLRAALRLWVTELRPQWRPNWLGDKHGSTGDEPFATAEEGNRILLAATTVLVEPPGINHATWEVVPGAAITITDEERPFLLHLRFLQEWLIAQGMGVGGGADAGPRVVAAGVIRGDATATPTRPVVNGLRVVATSNAGTATQLRLSFGGYSAPSGNAGPQYLVKALPWPGAPLKNLSVTFGGFEAGGFLLLVSKDGGQLADAELAALQLMVEVSQYA
jgi:hypothetical protein